MDERAGSGSGSSLRQRAEAAVREGPADDVDALTLDEIRGLLHDLRTHQVELEMQNDELRRTQVELDASRARYFDLYDLAPVGYCTLSEGGLVLEANLSLATMLGVSRRTLVGQPLSRFIRPDDQDVYYLHRKALVGTGGPHECELRMAMAAGAGLWVHLAATIDRDPAGAPLCRLVVSDVSGRKRAEMERERLEDELRQAQKMESVGRLAGGVAHDFNNMLCVILGHLELALLQVDRDHDLFADLLEVRKAAQRSAALTRQLLAFARKQTIEPQVLDLNATVGGLIVMLGRLIGENITMTWVPAKGLWPVFADPVQVDQTLTNLVVNSRDAISGVGHVVVETGNVAVDRPGVGVREYVRLSVRDDGCGMDASTLEHVFEPFFTTKGVGQGTGLGLATVYGIAEQNGGFVTIESAVGAGTTVHVHVPRREGSVPVEAGAAVDAPRAADGETVLVVEDEASLLAVTKRLLEGLGYRVLTAATPMEAVRVASEVGAGLDLLLTDVVMPQMDGGALAEKLLVGRSSLRVLFTSGYPRDLVEHRRIVRDRAAFLHKPFNRVMLALKVRQVLDGAADPVPTA